MTPPTPQIHLPEYLYHLQQDRKARPTGNVTNQDGDHFNKLLLTLLNGQQDLQKQSFNMIQDIMHRQESDNLMRNILIYDGKNIDLADWELLIEKAASLTYSNEYELATIKSTSTPYKMLKRLGND